MRTLSTVLEFLAFAILVELGDKHAADHMRYWWLLPLVAVSVLLAAAAAAVGWLVYR